MANLSSRQVFSIVLIVSFFSSSPWTSWHTSYWSKTIGCWRLICWLTLFLTWSKLLSSSLAVTSSSGISSSTTFCLDCTASREKNAAICCYMRNSSILNRRAPLSSRALHVFSDLFWILLVTCTTGKNICKNYEHRFVLAPFLQ